MHPEGFFISLVKEKFLCPRFGLDSAPRIFTKLLKIPFSVLRRLNILTVIYLDDMLLIDHVLIARNTVIFLLQQLELIQNLNK